MPIDPVAREILLALTQHVKRKAQRLLEGDPTDEESPLPPADEETLVSVKMAGAGPPPLMLLQNAFHLTPIEYSTLVCMLAAEVEPFFRTLIRAHQREGGKPWLEIGTIADILELPSRVLPDLFELFLPDGKLRASGLALVDDIHEAEVPMIHLRVKAPRRLLRFVLGVDQLPDGMRLAREPRHTLGSSLVPQAEREELLSRVRYAILRSDRLLVDLHGADGIGKKYLAEGIAAELGRPMLFVDVRNWERRNLSLHLADVVREAGISNALVYFDNWASLIDDQQAPPPMEMASDETGPPPSVNRPLPPTFARFLDSNAGVTFVGSRERHEQLERGLTPVTRVAMKFPGPLARGELWRRSILASGAAIGDGMEADELGRKFALDPARIVAATRAAVELATRKRPGAPLTVGRDEIYEASRHQLQHELASLAVRQTKAHKWEDLVIPTDVYHGLNELLSYMRHAGEVYEKQGFAARHSINPGLSALFSGPPGTGKTMCASIVARELDMELFRVDLSRIVSKWIGETEKNLGKVFDEAQKSHAVILFDEADSLFAKRTEVKSSIDRYANLEVSYLLQRMEQFSGVTILTTNFEDTIDTAFKRRITFKMRFERPDGEARAALWAKMFPSQAKLGDDVDFKEIGARFELSGGSIRNAVVRSAFLAAEAGTPILQEHILTAAAREAREMGSLVSDAPRPEPVEEGEPVEEPPPEEPAPRPRARMVPVTHPRR